MPGPHKGRRLDYEEQSGARHKQTPLRQSLPANRPYQSSIDGLEANRRLYCPVSAKKEGRNWDISLAHLATLNSGTIRKSFLYFDTAACAAAHRARLDRDRVITIRSL